ncbi:MAG: GNAT family N-acetyltransferase [Ilumatobacter sp.]|uniref:GNAT family N-acetyltransferase n=1 Tax=Ilumatobacter sp. TaxID=1967498 RepID=UPI003C74B0FF
MAAQDLSVIDVPDSSRFELLLSGERVGLADYSVSGDVVTVPHVETDPAHQGQGFAAVLMEGVLESVRTRGQTIRPVCPYAAAYMRRHPETQDLLTTGSTV